MTKRPLPYPDLILYNGKVRTFTSETAICEALACVGSRIVATGNSDEVRRLAGPETQAIDLPGKDGGDSLGSRTPMFICPKKARRKWKARRLPRFLHRRPFRRRYLATLSPMPPLARPKVMDRRPWQPDAGFSAQ